MSSIKQRQHLFEHGCDLAFDIYYHLTGPRTGTVVSSKLRETLASFLAVLTQVRKSSADLATLLRAAHSLLDRLTVFMDIAADFNGLEMIVRSRLQHHRLALAFSIRSMALAQPEQPLRHAL